MTEDPLAWLAARRPDLDWSRVEVVEGLPWWARRGTRALVVPTLRGARIHLSDGSPDVLLREAEHVAQMQRMGRARFVARYLALALRHGFGPAHPMEAPAYARQRDAGSARR